MLRNWAKFAFQTRDWSPERGKAALNASTSTGGASLRVNYINAGHGQENLRCLTPFHSLRKALKTQILLLTTVTPDHENHAPLLCTFHQPQLFEFHFIRCFQTPLDTDHPLKGFRPSTAPDILRKWSQSSRFSCTCQISVLLQGEEAELSTTLVFVI